MDKIIAFSIHPKARYIRRPPSPVTPSNQVDAIPPVTQVMQTQSAANTPAKDSDIPLEKIEEAVNKVSSFIREHTTTDKLTFHLDTKAHQGNKMVITVTENETNTVVRTIPAQEILAMAKAINNIARLLHVTA